MKKILLLSILLLCFSCSKDESSIEDKQEEVPEIFALSTLVSPSEGGSITGGEETYKDGEEVTLTAASSEDYEFKEWQGDISGSENPINFIMSSDKEVLAVFEKKVYSLNFDIIGKWYIQNSNRNNTSTVNKKINKQSEGSSCSIISIEFLEDGTYILITSEGEITGQYVLSGNQSMNLGNGEIEDLSFINDVLNFTITLNSGCSSTVSALFLTFIPDDTFEKELIRLGYDDTLDDFVNTRNIQTVKTLIIEATDKQIFDFTGLEDFSALEDLRVFLKNNTPPEFEIDFTSNLKLKYLLLDGTGITDLNLEKNSLIEYVYLHRTSLSGLISFPNNPLLQYVYLNQNYNPSGTNISLDFTNNPNLNIFSSAGTGIEKLDISNNPKMEELRVTYSEVQEIITSGVYEDFKIFLTDTPHNRPIDFAKFPNLEILYIQSNFESIDISANTKLNALKLSGAPNMKSLDLSNNPSLRDFDISNAPNLNCIKVNAEQLSKLEAEELYWTSGFNYSLECE